MRRFDAAVRELLRSRDISLADLARKLGISAPAVSMSLGGRCRFPAGRIDTLFRILGLSDAEREHLRLLYLEDLAPKSLAGAVDSARLAVADLDRRMGKAGDLANGLLYAERAFDDRLGQTLSAGPKKAYFTSVLDRFQELKLADRKTHRQLREAVEKARSPVDFSRVAGRMLALLIRVVAGVEDASALDRLVRLLDPEYVDHLVEVAGELAKRMRK